MDYFAIIVDVYGPCVDDIVQSIGFQHRMDYPWLLIEQYIASWFRHVVSPVEDIYVVDTCVGIVVLLVFVSRWVFVRSMPHIPQWRIVVIATIDHVGPHRNFVDSGLFVDG